MTIPFLLRLALFLTGSAFAAAAAETGASPVLFPKIEVYVDRVRVEASSGKIRIPANAKTIDFSLGESVWNTQNPYARRFRYMFDGVDKSWQQRTGDMGLAVFFYDESGDLVGKRYFWANHNSPDWDSRLESSHLRHRNENLRVPPQSTKLSLVISSAGPPDTYGVYVLQNLLLRRQVGKAPAETIFHAASSSADQQVREKEWGQWTRDGTHAPMAQRIRLGGSPAEAFCILDDNPLAHAEWHLLKDFYPKVLEGDELTLSWDEMYSIGLADRVSVSYSVPPAGLYKLRVNLVDVMGVPAEERSVVLEVYTPYWMSLWFWIGMFLLSSIPAGFGVRQIIRNRVRKQLRQLEQEHMVERERLRIARDIHDDLGARLTHISLVSGSAKKESANLEEARQSFQKISNMTRELVSALYETVWTVDPGNDHLNALVDHLIQLIDVMCAPAGIQYRIHAPKISGDFPVTSNVRHNVSLAVKEALNNAIKYSGATEIHVQFDWKSPFLEIVVQDNGRGFAVASVSEGRGLKNMRARMETVGGAVEIESHYGKGTRISFRIPVSG